MLIELIWPPQRVFDIHEEVWIMSLEKLEEKLSSLSEETKSLYNKIDEKYRITINGKCSLELVDISNFKVVARGKKR